MIIINKVDDNFLKLSANTEQFRYFVEQFRVKDKNCYFNPMYKNGKWDGFIRFLHNNGLFQKGLLFEIIRLSKLNSWPIKFDKDILISKYSFTDDEINNSLLDVKLFEDQFKHIRKILKYNIGLIKLPTSTGKSFIEISLMNLYKSKGLNNQIIIVPRSSLAEQIYSDLISKSKNISKDSIGKLYDGTKGWDKEIVVATWQSLNNLLDLDIEYGKRFEVLIQDETHVSSSSAKKIKGVINSFSPEIKYGFSATILSKNKNPLEYYNLIGLFGPIISKDTIINLQNKKRIAKSEIHMKLLKYQVQKEISSYKDYEEFIRYSEIRRKYIKYLIEKHMKHSPEENFLILIRNVDFVKEFYNDLINSGFNARLIHGKTPIKERVSIKKEMQGGSGMVLLATTGVFTLGENVPNLHTLILAQSRRSETETIQQVGRLLRISPGKKKALIYDIVDDLIVKKELENGDIVRKNFGKRHMKSRIEAFKEHTLDVTNIEEVHLVDKIKIFEKLI